MRAQGRNFLELFSDPLRERLGRLRRDLHRYPELAFEEHHTAERLQRELEVLKPVELGRVAGTGVVARLRGRSRRTPAVVIRGDIDALPIQEETGLDYASEVPGVMHACGHDVHATWTVGAAHLLAADPAAGDVLILLQPAEEIGTGAQSVLASGALDGVGTIFGGHVDLRFPVGEVVVQEGPLAAAADVFQIELVGRGAHGARPHEAADPIVGASALVGALQTIVSRQLNPAFPAVVSVGTIHGGSASNVIPERVTLTGTLRATEADTRKILLKEVRRIARGIATLYGLEAQVQLELGPPALVNAPEPTGWARRAATRILGEEAVVPLGFLNLAGEDFACYLESIQGCFLRIGARVPGEEPIPAHTPRFVAAESSIYAGAAVLAEAARIASAALAERYA